MSQKLRPMNGRKTPKRKPTPCTCGSGRKAGECRLCNGERPADRVTRLSEEEHKEDKARRRKTEPEEEESTDLDDSLQDMKKGRKAKKTPALCTNCMIYLAEKNDTWCRKCNANFTKAGMRRKFTTDYCQCGHSRGEHYPSGCADNSKGDCDCKEFRLLQPTKLRKEKPGDVWECPCGVEEVCTRKACSQCGRPRGDEPGRPAGEGKPVGYLFYEQVETISDTDRPRNPGMLGIGRHRCDSVSGEPTVTLYVEGGRTKHRKIVVSLKALRKALKKVKKASR